METNDQLSLTLHQIEIEDLKKEVSKLKKEVENLWGVIRVLSAHSPKAHNLRRKQLEQHP